MAQDPLFVPFGKSLLCASLTMNELFMSTFSLNNFDDDDFHGPVFQFMMNRMNAPRPRRGSRGEDGFR